MNKSTTCYEFYPPESDDNSKNEFLLLFEDAIPFFEGWTWRWNKIMGPRYNTIYEEEDWASIETIRNSFLNELHVVDAKPEKEFLSRLGHLFSLDGTTLFGYRPTSIKPEKPEPRYLATADIANADIVFCSFDDACWFVASDDSILLERISEVVQKHGGYQYVETIQSCDYAFWMVPREFYD
ncbi:MAG: hypothetical protein IPK50_06335 [Fibrobacterota bacterium]|nr:MAG: hypothetical protein IPK50_06335 [Fibrobacterota bacterium]